MDWLDEVTPWPDNGILGRYRARILAAEWGELANGAAPPELTRPIVVLSTRREADQ